MRIHDNQAAGIDVTRLAKGVAEQADRAGSGPPAARSRPGPDEVRLSGLAEKIQTLDPGSEQFEARLESLSRLVESGRYQPDAEALADSLIDQALADGMNSGKES
jgi:anti-sigma28 factor (negative regulator of flagellin synthesis)